MTVRMTIHLFAAAVLAGCAGDPAPASPSKKATPAEPATAPAADDGGELTSEARSAIAAALGDYETVRGKLAADDLQAVASAAQALHTSASAAARAAPAGLADNLSRLEAEAGKLHGAASSDPVAVRNAFGEVSRAAVGLLAAEESLRGDLHVFECPMASGYQKWVQPGETLDNPYMGTSMPGCGSPSTWSE